MRKLKRQAGFGLLELMLSMVIVALLLIMATRYYQSARTTSRINQGVSEITEIIHALDNIAIGSGSFKNVTLASIAPYLSAGEVQGTNILDPWGGTVAMGTADDTSFQFSFPGLAGDCQKLSDALGSLQNTNYTNKFSCTDTNTLEVTHYLNPQSS